MAIIALKAWYVPEYEPLKSLLSRPYDLRLAKNSLLKSALRADFLDESQAVERTEWFQRYLAGEAVEFYIEGSGSYAIANIDLISHEVYFVKHQGLSSLEPTIFFSYQVQRQETSDALRAALMAAIEDLNKTSRLAIALEQSHRPGDAPLKLSSTLMTRLRRCLLFVADVSPVLELNTDPPQPLLSPQVCVEVGYALQAKQPDQILLVQVGESLGQFPFDLPARQRLLARDEHDLGRRFPQAIAQQLQRYSLC